MQSSCPDRLALAYWFYRAPTYHELRQGIRGVDHSLEPEYEQNCQIRTLPVKLELEANYYVEQPDAFGPEWMISFNITPVVTNFLDQWVKQLF